MANGFRDKTKESRCFFAFVSHLPRKIFPDFVSWSSKITLCLRIEAREKSAQGKVQENLEENWSFSEFPIIFEWNLRQLENGEAFSENISRS